MKEDNLDKTDVLIIDGYNMIHRCRFQWGGGLATGEHQIVYNFFRTLRSLIAQFNPSVVYFPLDGKPAARLNAYDQYKANRRIVTKDPEEIAYWESFHRQKRLIIDTLKKDYPVRTVFHPEHECDDLVPYIISEFHSTEDVVVASSDTDFIQLLTEDNVRLYNPISKSYRECTDYDYVAWKAMVGDTSDNIPGVRGIGKKTATKILTKDGELDRRMEDDLFKTAFNKSYNLIKFIDITNDKDGIIYTRAEFDEESVVQDFEYMGFNSMLSDQYTETYFNTFRALK